MYETGSYLSSGLRKEGGDLGIRPLSILGVIFTPIHICSGGTMNDRFRADGVQNVARSLGIKQIELVVFAPGTLIGCFQYCPAAAFSESTALSKIADPKSPLAPVINNTLPPIANLAESAHNCCSAGENG